MKRRDAQVIREIKDFLDEHLFEDHPIKDICRRFVINREKLQSGFIDLCGHTVHAYLIHQRMASAARRLIETDDSIKAIALETGYKKQRSFNKTFKSLFNLTPAAYRRVNRVAEEVRQ